MDEKKLPWSFRLLAEEDNPQMLSILKQSPIESGSLSLCFDREPNIFIMANLKYKPVKYVGIFYNEQLVGFGLIGYHDGNVRGETQRVFHFSNVFMLKEHRNKGLMLKAHAHFFKEIFDKSNLGYAVIMRGNKNAERFIGWQSEKFPYIPYSSMLSTLEVRNIIISFKKAYSKTVVRKALNKDIEQIVSLLNAEFSKRLFAPLLTVEEFKGNLILRPDFSIDNYYVVERGNQVIGTCAAWDCNSFKQIRISSYNKKFKIIRNIFHLLTLLYKFPPLPARGQSFKAVYITDCVVENRDPKLMKAMLRTIYNEYRTKKFNLIVFGSYKNDNLLKATKGFFYQSVESNVYLYHKDKSFVEELKQQKLQPYIDVAFL